MPTELLWLWWIEELMNCCSYVSMCLPLFISNALQPRENPVFHVHRIQLQESTKTGSVQWTKPVGQLVRCLYVVGARSSVLSVTPSALAASIYQPAGAFSHTKAYSWEQILRKDIKAYISIPEVFFRAFPHISAAFLHVTGHFRMTRTVPKFAGLCSHMGWIRKE